MAGLVRTVLGDMQWEAAAGLIAPVGSIQNLWGWVRAAPSLLRFAAPSA